MSLNYDRDYESLKSIIRTEKNNSISPICSLIRENSSVLEYGTSTGYMTRYLNEELNCTVTGVEVCEESSRIAKEFCKAMHCCDIESTDLKSSISDTFDYICFADVLEHLRNPWEALRSIKPLLRPQGKVLISIPNICHNSILHSLFKNEFKYTETGLMDRTHLRFFGPENIEDLFDGTGFEIESLNFTYKDHDKLIKSDKKLTRTQKSALLKRDNRNAYQIIISAKKV